MVAKRTVSWRINANQAAVVQVTLLGVVLREQRTQNSLRGQAICDERNGAAAFNVATQGCPGFQPVTYITR